MKAFSVGIGCMIILALFTGGLMSRFSQPTAKQSLALQSVHLNDR